MSDTIWGDLEEVSGRITEDTWRDFTDGVDELVAAEAFDKARLKALIDAAPPGTRTFPRHWFQLHPESLWADLVGLCDAMPWTYSDNDAIRAAIARLIASPAMSGIRAISPLPELVPALCANAACEALVDVNFKQIPVNRAILQHVVDAPWASQLEKLTISEVDGVDEGTVDSELLRPLVDASHLNLKSLSIEGWSIADGISIDMLSDAKHLTSLESLSFAMQEGAEGQIADFLESADFLTRLKRLDLAECFLGTEACETIFACTHLASVETLRMYNWRGGEGGARALAEATHLSNLKVLQLGVGELGWNGTEALAEATHLEGLTELSLSYNDIETDGIEMLIDAGILDGLERLDLWSNNLDDIALDLIANHPGLAGLKELQLYGNHFTEEGVRDLADSALTDSLESLELYGNAIGDDGLLALCQVSWTRLKNLNVGDTGLSSAAPGILAEHANAFPMLEELGIGHNEFGDVGTSRLSVRGIFPTLKKLEIYKAGVQASGITEVLWAGAFPSLSSLYISSNAIGDEGVSAIARSVRPWRSLVFNDCDTTLKSIEEVAASPACKGLRSLQIEGLWSDEGRALIDKGSHFSSSFKIQYGL